MKNFVWSVLILNPHLFQSTPAVALLTTNEVSECNKFALHLHKFRPAVLSNVKFCLSPTVGVTNFASHFILLKPAVFIKLISKICLSPIACQDLSKSHTGSNKFG